MAELLSCRSIAALASAARAPALRPSAAATAGQRKIAA